MKHYATPRLVIHSFDDEVSTADIVRASLYENEHEQDDGFNVDWFTN